MDKVDGGSGDDTLIYNMSANLNSAAQSTKKHKHDHFDEYKGGSGIDTLQLEFTLDQWMQDDVQADIAAYLKFLSEETESKHKKKDKADSTKQETAFGDFSRLENSYKQSPMGSGLGLSIVKRTANLMGCTLNVESTVGVGTTFELSI